MSYKILDFLNHLDGQGIATYYASWLEKKEHTETVTPHAIIEEK